MPQPPRSTLGVPPGVLPVGSVAVDATNVLYRTFHALRSSGMRHAGRPVWAVHGLLTYLAKWTRELRPERLVLAFDPVGGCPYRRSRLPSYKSSHLGPARDLAYQLDWARSLAGQLGLYAATDPEWEADDMLASTAQVMAPLPGSLVVVSSDRDVYQLASSRLSVLSPDGMWTTEQSLRDRLGVSPHEYRHVAALRGEPGDGIPGVPGIGLKKAIALVKHFGSVDAALRSGSEALRAVVGPSAAKSLLEHGGVALLALEVSALQSDLSVDLSASGLGLVDTGRVRRLTAASGLTAAGESLASSLESASY